MAERGKGGGRDVQTELGRGGGGGGSRVLVVAGLGSGIPGIEEGVTQRGSQKSSFE